MGEVNFIVRKYEAVYMDVILVWEEKTCIKYVNVTVAEYIYFPLTNIMKIKPDILMESTSPIE